MTDGDTIDTMQGVYGRLHHGLLHHGTSPAVCPTKASQPHPTPPRSASLAPGIIAQHGPSTCKATTLHRPKNDPRPSRFPGPREFHTFAFSACGPFRGLQGLDLFAQAARKAATVRRVHVFWSEGLRVSGLGNEKRQDGCNKCDVVML